MSTAPDDPSHDDRRVPVGFGPCPCGGGEAAAAPPAALEPLCDWRVFPLGRVDAVAALRRLERSGLCGYALTTDCGCACAAALAAGPLPVAALAGLRQPAAQERFAVRAFAYARWRRLRRSGLSRRALRVFHARHKYLVMSRHLPTYRALGRLLAAELPLAEQAERALALLMAALRRPPRRAGLANALQHIQGYLKRHLDAAERAGLSAAIESYRNGSAPLLAPLALLQHHFRRHPDPYIGEQVLLWPPPALLALLERAQENAER